MRVVEESQRGLAVQARDGEGTGVRPRAARALVLGAAGVTLLCAVTPYNDFRLKNTYLYGNHLPIGGLLLFALLALVVNPVLRRRSDSGPGAGRDKHLAEGSRSSTAIWDLPAVGRFRLLLRPFSPGELLLIWVMLMTGAGLASSGLWRYLGPIVVAPAYFAGSGSRWIEMFRDSPDWLLLTRDPASPLALRFYHGLHVGESVPWAAWTQVVAAWGLAFAFVVCLSIGVCALFSRQWVERERLSYPLAQLPLQIAEESGRRRPLSRNPVFWAGCLAVVILHGISTAHYFAPSFPDAINRFDIGAFQQTPPWDALGLPTLEVFFAVIGAIYLIPADVSLTLWFTFVVLHLVRVVREMRGYDPLLIGPLNHEGAMGVGAFLVWAVWLVWIARPHWRKVWGNIWHHGRAEEAREPVPARGALALTVIGVAGLFFWMCAAGITPWIAAAVLGLICVILLVLTRIMAEAGLLFLMTPFIPTDMMAFWGTGYYTSGAAGATLMAEVVLIHDPREHMMPAIANAFAISGQSGMRPRAFAGGIALALTVGFFVSFVSFTWLSYRFGAVTLDAYGTDGAPHWSMDRALQYATTPLPVNPGDLEALGLGGLLAGLFIWLKARFLWWPFGPIGLAMASTYAMGRIWFSVFVGWAFRAVTLRVGGLRAFQAALPFALGLLLGEGLFGGASAIWGILTGVAAPPFLPN